jgi:hypothetical protein
VQELAGLAIDDMSIVHLVTFAHSTHFKHHAMISIAENLILHMCDGTGT